MGNDFVSAGERSLASVLERLKDSASVNVVYGESRSVADKTIIPVAMVAYWFGSGAGGGSGGPEGGAVSGTGGGSGGGGAVRVRPLGVLEVTAGRTRFVPVVNATRIMLAAMLIGLGLSVMGMMRRRRWRKMMERRHQPPEPRPL
jgi:uncharacterized spore protein YtfJ